MLYPEPSIGCVRREGGRMPFPNATLFRFRATKEPESALVLETTRPVLLATGAILHCGDYSQNNPQAGW